MAKINVGIVGCGAVAVKRHIPAFRRLSNVSIQAVCDNNIDVAKKVANQFGIPNVHSDLSGMLSRNKLDIVDICTPPHTHATIAVGALEYGCHVLLEKPMALSVVDCDAMIHASEENKKQLCIIHNVLFHPPLVEAKKIVQSGAIGEVVGTRVFLADPKEEMIMRKDYWIHKLPGGVIGETCPHPTYLSLAFMDKVKSVDVFAKCVLEHPWAKFDEFRIELEGEKTLGSVMISYSTNRYNATMDIWGTEGALSLNMQTMTLIKYGAKPKLSYGSVAQMSINSISQNIGQLINNGCKVVFGRMPLGHDTVVERFVESVVNDTKPPVTGYEGRETTRVMELIVKRLNEKYG